MTTFSKRDAMLVASTCAILVGCALYLQPPTWLTQRFAPTSDFAEVKFATTIEELAGLGFRCTERERRNDEGIYRHTECHTHIPWKDSLGVTINSRSAHFVDGKLLGIKAFGKFDDERLFDFRAELSKRYAEVPDPESWGGPKNSILYKYSNDSALRVEKSGERYTYVLATQLAKTFRE